LRWARKLTFFVFKSETGDECRAFVTGMGEHAREVTSKALGFVACTSDKVASCHDNGVLWFCRRLGEGFSKRLGGSLDSATFSKLAAFRLSVCLWERESKRLGNGNRAGSGGQDNHTEGVGKSHGGDSGVVDLVGFVSV
jgi:hypothetical protein